MKIGILGTRGIPNQHGGFEQFAEFVAPALVAKGHEVSVYNSSLHPFQGSSWQGVTLIKQQDPENRIGTAGQFIYDLRCILDARKRNFDIILQLGYTSSSIWQRLLPGRAAIVTNMDGLEWKRSKYSSPVQSFLKRAEKWAVKGSDLLIADSRGIQTYLYEKYGRASTFIAYGATLSGTPDATVTGKYGLQPYSYNLLIARMEPENNIETILQGCLASEGQYKLILIGNYSNKFGSYLKNKYQDPRAVFLGPIYDLAALNSLRYYSNLYFHGHSVGGTNPSLLEAMASDALIVAHDNIFNRSVLEGDAFYFSSAADITALLDRRLRKSDHTDLLANNTRKIREHYSWDEITRLLEDCLSEALRIGRRRWDHS
jgi:glycosyltransferase involved in cell wall biosynthesis